MRPRSKTRRTGTAEASSASSSRSGGIASASAACESAEPRPSGQSGRRSRLKQKTCSFLLPVCVSAAHAMHSAYRCLHSVCGVAWALGMRAIEARNWLAGGCNKENGLTSQCCCGNIGMKIKSCQAVHRHAGLQQETRRADPQGRQSRQGWTLATHPQNP